MTKKTTKRALLLSVLSMMLCVAMLVGSTFAWFTDSVTSGMNKIVAGNLDVELYHSNGKVENEEIDENTELFVSADDKEFQWEPGAMLYENFTVKNAGSLALKYKLMLNAECNSVDGRSLENVLKVAVLDKTFNGDRAEAMKANFDKTVAEFVSSGAVLASGELLNKDDAENYAVIIYWEPSENDDLYNFNNGRKEEELYIELGVNLEATQAASESDSFDKDYDSDAKYPDATEYTLSEFNNLTEIPEKIRTVYVDLGGASLEGGLIIGNNDIADHYNYGGWDSDIVPENFPYDTGRTNQQNGRVRKLYSTGKKGINLILTGAVLGATDTGTFNAGNISLKVPDASSVTFEKVTFGAGQMSLSSWQESFQSTTAKHCVKSIVFNMCTFQGNWLQNGAIDTADMLFKDCRFEYYENTASYNNSNPIWIQNMGQCNVVIEGCIFNACRPIKLWENAVSGTVTIKGNTFNMQKCSKDDETTYKDDAILFSTIAGPLGNVIVSGNTVNGGTAFLTFFNPEKITMADGATFTVSDNVLNNTKNSVEWKTTTEFIPDFVIVK